jgi:hypothetical protein
LDFEIVGMYLLVEKLKWPYTILPQQQSSSLTSIDPAQHNTRFTHGGGGVE